MGGIDCLLGFNACLACLLWREREREREASVCLVVGKKVVLFWLCTSGWAPLVIISAN